MMALSLGQLKRRRKRIGERLRALRIDAGVTIEQVAGACGVTRFRYMRFENGDVPFPVELVPTITRVLGVGVDQIFPSGDKPLAKAA